MIKYEEFQGKTECASSQGSDDFLGFRVSSDHSVYPQRLENGDRVDIFSDKKNKITLVKGIYYNQAGNEFIENTADVVEVNNQKTPLFLPHSFLLRLFSNNYNIHIKRTTIETPEVK